MLLILSRIANVIFLESPVGAGFLYLNTSLDCKLNGDKRTTDDSYTFLVNWPERFPQYKDRDFYITGESYVGHYVPELASAILTNNRITNNIVIKLKGIAVEEYDPCCGSYANTYLDLPDVQKSLHANVTGLPYPWSACSCFVGGCNWNDALATLLHI